MTGRYKAYPEYKLSNNSELGYIPSHWGTSKVRYVSYCLDGKRVPLNGTERGEMQGSVPYWGANSVVDHINEYIFDEDLVLLGEDGAPFFDTTKDVAFFVQGKVWPNNHVHVLRPEENKVNAKFLTYALNCVDYHLYITGSTRDKLNQSAMNDIALRICSLEEQQKIANFLDHETAKIDTLIVKQEKLIKLLKEKRQAVISHAVTKGLNPDAPMKDSGVEWLGEVPEHWVASKLKNHTKQIVDGAHFTPTYSESGIPFLRVTDVTSKSIDLNKTKYIPESEHKDLIKRCHPQKGDLLLSKNGTIGVPKVIDWDFDFSIFVSLCLIKFKDSLLSTYSSYVFESHQIAEQINGGIKQSTVINLHLDKIENFYFSIPPVDEQQAIVFELDRKTKQLDLLISKAEKGIDLIKERKTALISAAVTGKIDVRDWQGEA